ncbi:hypothetical protein O181_000519 [Austropuccinia psidii MF-1]|uniref:Uncharacterized protein n=1 Tax=Austropuccinia psidii MF-1 TaxID=1389203 RepID=A0A9Q3B8N8_9BASI|nr:hypothetical protein [Austropuccinia psidii MF-1]
MGASCQRLDILESDPCLAGLVCLVNEVVEDGRRRERARVPGENEGSTQRGWPQRASASACVTLTAFGLGFAGLPRLPPERGAAPLPRSPAARHG